MRTVFSRYYGMMLEGLGVDDYENCSDSWKKKYRGIEPDF